MYNQALKYFFPTLADGCEKTSCAYFFITITTWMLTITHTGGSRIS